MKLRKQISRPFVESICLLIGLVFVCFGEQDTKCPQRKQLSKVARCAQNAAFIQFGVESSRVNHSLFRTPLRTLLLLEVSPKWWLVESHLSGWLCLITPEFWEGDGDL